MVNVNGGGESGQAGAVRHGITRALIDYDATLKPVLKKAGLVTRDAREVERKKVGLAQSAPPQAVLEALSPAVPAHKAACGRLFCFWATIERCGRCSIAGLQARMRITTMTQQDHQNRHGRRHRIHRCRTVAAAGAASACELRVDHFAPGSGHAGGRDVSQPARARSTSSSASRPTRRSNKCDVVFFATPNGVAMQQARALVRCRRAHHRHRRRFPHPGCRDCGKSGTA